MSRCRRGNISQYENVTPIELDRICLLIIHRWKSPAAYPMNYTQVKIPCTVPDELYTGENRQHHTLWVIHRCKSPSPYPMNYTQVKIASTIPNELYTGENHTLWVIHRCKSSSPYPMNYLDGDNSIFVGWGLFSICFLFLFANCLPIQWWVCKMPEKFNHYTKMPLGSSWSTYWLVTSLFCV